ncbi:hypothetical protein ACFY3V_37200 [Streptosporangium sp. NPDC000095]|uniref:hypothetical protein n=1 Tax=Streptosporangium sp. NPDC000095 TaxID=3366184 RepID=UPI0036A4A339
MFEVSRDSDVSGRPAPIAAKVNPTSGRMNHITLLFILGSAPLLLANWFIALMILGPTCTLSYEGGNITECVGGLSEEELATASGVVALVLLLIQMGLIVMVRRRTRGS